MSKGNLSTRILGPILLIVSSGCAGAYHDYEAGCVPYNYCAQPPLPYVEYGGCPTPIAERYRALFSALGVKESIDASVAAEPEDLFP